MTDDHDLMILMHDSNACTWKLPRVPYAMTYHSTITVSQAAVGW